jgi:AraC family transcriptional regulator, alkane utilization regulator
MTETPSFPIETPFLAEAIPGPNGSDVLSDMLRVFRVTGAALLRGEFNLPWAWETPPASAIASLLHPGATRVIIFHIVADGSCWVEVGDDERRILRKGDIVGFPHGHAHRMGNGEADPLPLASLLPPSPWRKLPVLTCGGDGERTHIVCTYLRCDSLLFDPFIAGLPTLMIVRRDKLPSAPWFDATVSYLISEAVKGRPGTSCVMARLTELLFIEILRLHMTQLRDQDVGWFAALNDRYICRALNVFHSRPAEQWTIEMLAREIGLSRSALARRFHQLLNMSPIHYLATWRLHLGACALRDSSEPIAIIAEQVGYTSEEGFSRAFRRNFGSSPSTWRQSQI